MIVNRKKFTSIPKNNALLIIIGLLFIALSFVYPCLIKFKSTTLAETIQKQLTLSDKITKVIHYINSVPQMIVIVVIVYNFANIYKSFILFNVICFSEVFTSMVKLIYQQTSPNDNSIEIKYCPIGYIFPSDEIFTTVLFYLTLWKIIKSSKKTPTNLFSLISFIIILIYLVLYVAIKTFEGGYFDEAILLSVILAVGVYLVVFEGIKINFNDGKQFIKFIKLKIYVYFLITIVIGIIVGILYYLFEKNESLKCRGNYGSDLFSIKIEEEGKYNGIVSLISSCYFIGYFFSVLGLKFEIKFIFEVNYENWLHFNFIKEDSQNDLEEKVENFLTLIPITEDTKWNYTSVLYDILRLITLIILWGISSVPYVLNVGTKNVIYVAFIKITLTFVLYGWCGFFLNKFIMSKTNCVNRTLLSMIQK